MDRKVRLYSYVVEHDCGTAPNPFGGLCTLVGCKHKSKGSNRRNIVELAKRGDWIVGTGGKSARSAGHGKLIYAMRLDENIPIGKYRERFSARKDAQEGVCVGKCALVSRYYFYFGGKREPIPSRFLKFPYPHGKPGLEKTGPGFKSHFSPETIAGFANWLKNKYKKSGCYGTPCCRPGNRCCPFPGEGGQVRRTCK